MNRGFYSASAAMMNQMLHFDSTANNLANVNTHGFKRHAAIHHDFQRGLLKRIDASRSQLQISDSGQATESSVERLPKTMGVLGTGTVLQATWKDFSDGALEQTEAPLDFALSGKGLFSIKTPEGKTLYTRHGGFQLDADGYLVTGKGYQVQGQKGAIQIGQGQKVDVDAAGQIYLDGRYLDTLAVVEFEQPQLLTNMGERFYESPVDQQALLATQTEVHQRTLERSNVDVASEMVNMISVMRSYQIAQKALQSEDDMTGKLINDIGKSA